MHPLEQTTSFGIKPFRANQYMGKSLCAEATEKYQKHNPIKKESNNLDFVKTKVSDTD